MIGKSLRLVVGGVATIAAIATSIPFFTQNAAALEMPAALEEMEVEPAEAIPPQARQRYDENLAEALGITLDELNAARDEAFVATVNDAVAEGAITQEQADLMLARHALRGYVDRRELTAEVLGMTVEELDAAIKDGAELKDLVKDAGMTREEFGEAMKAAFEAALAEAVADGVITQEQADLILSNPPQPGGKGGPKDKGKGGPGEGGPPPGGPGEG